MSLEELDEKIPSKQEKEPTRRSPRLIESNSIRRRYIRNKNQPDIIERSAHMSDPTLLSLHDITSLDDYMQVIEGTKGINDPSYLQINWNLSKTHYS